MNQTLAPMPSCVGLLKPRPVGMSEPFVEEDLADSRGFERAAEQFRFKPFYDG